MLVLGPLAEASACALYPHSAGGGDGCQLGAIRLPGGAHLAHLEIDSSKGGVEGRLVARKLAHQLQQGWSHREAEQSDQGTASA